MDYLISVKPSDGIRILANIIAAGIERIDSVIRCWTRFIFSNWICSIETKAIIIDPETVDMPAVININNSLLLIFDKYGLTNKGASTWPIIIFAVAPSPTGPPMLKIFSKINEIDLEDEKN